MQKLSKRRITVYYLSDTSPLHFNACSMRRFFKGEKHITRVCEDSVLILMFDGILRFAEDGFDTELRAGEYYIQRGGLFQEGRLASDEPRYFYIHFDGEFTKDAGLPIRGAFPSAEVINDVRRLEQLYFSPRRNSFAVNGLFYSILGSLAAKRGSFESGTDIVGEIQSFILARFRESSFSLREIAKKFNFSNEYIIKLFRSGFSKTPHRYITELRIEYAKQLMLSTERGLGDIAAECGYSDYSVFYKSFLQNTGKSPRDWRESV